MEFGPYFIYLIIGYLLGSIPSAVWVSRVLCTDNPTQKGSHNPGATNMLRLGGKKAAIITFLGDFTKGVGAITMGLFLQFSQSDLTLLMLICIVGHMYPIFNRFVGGKGVATFFGCLTMIDVTVSGIVMACWLIIANILKISSLSAIVSVSIAPFVAWILNWHATSIVLLIVTCLLILWRHKTNIKQLLQKKEI